MLDACGYNLSNEASAFEQQHYFGKGFWIKILQRYLKFRDFF